MEAGEGGGRQPCRGVWGGVSCQTLADSRKKASVYIAEAESAGLSARLGKPQGCKRVPQQPQNQQHGGDEEPSKVWRGVFHV